MRNSPLLITLATALILGLSGPLRAQAPPAATTPNRTNAPAAWGVLDSPVVFEWKSGTLSSFLDQIKKVFGCDLKQRAEIPDQMLNTRVPAMKITTSQIWDVLNLYAQISANYPELGRWAWHYPPPGPHREELAAVYLVPPKEADTADSFSVRAFSLRDIPEKEQNLVWELINLEKGRLQILAAEEGIKPSLLRGDLYFHRETGICVATGGKTLVEMVGSVIDAFRAGRGFGGSRPYAPKSEVEK